MASTVVSDDKAKQKRELQERFTGYSDFETALGDFVYEYVPEGAVPYAPFLIAAHALIPVYPDSAPQKGIASNKELGLLRISLNEARERSLCRGRAIVPSAQPRGLTHGCMPIVRERQARLWVGDPGF